MTRDRVRAATLVEPGRYEIRDYPVPDPAPGCVVVRMALSGICGTDKHTYQGYVTQYAGTEAPRSIPFPIIQGHENVGTVAAIGGDGRYDGLRRGAPPGGGPGGGGGQRRLRPLLLLPPRLPVFRLREHGGLREQHERGRPPHLFGGWSEYIYVVPGSFLVKVPDELPSEVAVLAETMAVTVRPGPGQAVLGGAQRGLPVRRHRGGPGGRPAGDVLPR